MGIKEFLKKPITAETAKPKSKEDEAKPKAEYVTFVVCKTCSKSYPADFFFKCPYCQTPNPQKE